MEEFSIFLGLRRRGHFVDLGHKPESEIPFVNRCFGTVQRDKIKRPQLLQVLNDLSVLDDRVSVQDFARIYILFVFHCLLFPTSSYYVPSFLLPYVDSLHDIDTYAWGQAVYMFLVNSIIKGKAYVDGCTLGLCIWAYEHARSLGKTTHIEAVPRFKMWVDSKKRPSAKTILREVSELHENAVQKEMCFYEAEMKFCQLCSGIVGAKAVSSSAEPEERQAREGDSGKTDGNVVHEAEISPGCKLKEYRNETTVDTIEVARTPLMNEERSFTMDESAAKQHSTEILIHEKDQGWDNIRGATQEQLKPPARKEVGTSKSMNDTRKQQAEVEKKKLNDLVSESSKKHEKDADTSFEETLKEDNDGNTISGEANKQKHHAGHHMWSENAADDVFAGASNAQISNSRDKQHQPDNEASIWKQTAVNDTQSSGDPPQVFVGAESEQLAASKDKEAEVQSSVASDEAAKQKQTAPDNVCCQDAVVNKLADVESAQMAGKREGKAEVKSNLKSGIVHDCLQEMPREVNIGKLLQVEFNMQRGRVTRGSLKNEILHTSQAEDAVDVSSAEDDELVNKTPRSRSVKKVKKRYQGRSMLRLDHRQFVDQFVARNERENIVWKDNAIILTGHHLLEVLAEHEMSSVVIDAWMRYLMSPLYKSKYNPSMQIVFLSTFLSGNLVKLLGGRIKFTMRDIYYLEAKLTRQAIRELEQLDRATVSMCRYVAMPINEECHWHLLAYDVKKNKFIHMNSSLKAPRPTKKKHATAKPREEIVATECAKVLHWYMNNQKKAVEGPFQFTVKRDCRQQGPDTLDCGIWSCMFAETLIQDNDVFKELVHKTAHVGEFRARIVYELLKFGA